MNTLQERLGVAVEADAARFSGEEFADAWGGAVAGRVKRRRQVRAAAYSGGTMLAAGALVLGGTKLPWATLAGPASVGGVDCVTATPSVAAPVVLDSVSQSAPEGERFEVSSHQTDDRVDLMITDGVVEVVDGQSGVSVESWSDGTHVVTFLSGARTGFYVTDQGDGSWVVTTWDESDGAPGRDFGSPVPSPTVIAGGPSASDDCLSPSPVASESASPSPVPSASALDLPEQQLDLEGSPFTVGFAFPFDEYGTDQLYIEDPVWLTPDEANAAMRSMYQVPSDAPQAAGTDLVARVTIADSLGGQAGFTGGVGGARDPELMLDGGASQASHSNPGAYFVQGASFVAVRDGVVVGTLAVGEDPQPFPAMNYDIALDRQNVDPSRDMWATLLNPDGAFVDAGGQTLTGEYDLYAVAGSGVYDAQGVYSGTFYVWKKLERP